MWGKLLARSFPHTPFKNSYTKNKEETRKDTDRQIEKQPIVVSFFYLFNFFLHFML